MSLKFFPVLFAVLLFGSDHHVDFTSAKEPVDLPEEFHARGGLPNFFNKASSDKAITVAYLGGSITEAKNGWRELTFARFQSQYPHVKFTHVSAAIGGTGSDLGVFRMDGDVLKHDPDLLFVEFAVNDNGLPTETIYKTMEGIVRKMWKHNPSADICFVYTLAENSIEAINSGKYQNSAQAMEKIAEHYQVPSIHMGIEVIKLLNEGKLIFKGNPAEANGKIVFTKDGVHPEAVGGHPIYAEVVDRNFKKMEAFAKHAPHTLSEPFVKDNWESAQMIPFGKIKKNSSWKELPADDEMMTKFSNFMPVIYKAVIPDAAFTVKFQGSVLGVYDIIGPKTGFIDVTLDGKEATDLARFDAYCTYYRKNYSFLNDLSDGTHEVTFTVTGKPIDKQAILAKRNTTMTNPADYNENGWYVNSLLLVGDILKK